jgi:hypothetical protein
LQVSARVIDMGREVKIATRDDILGLQGESRYGVTDLR